MLRRTEFNLDRFGQNAYASLADPNPSPRLAIFCHGWHGDYIKTWGKLLESAGDSRFPSDLDIVFLGYGQSPTAADLLAHWLAKTIHRIFPRFEVATGMRQYSELLLVGHSLGAVAMRRAVLRLVQKKWRPLSDPGRVRQLLFAPPLAGVNWDYYATNVLGGPKKLMYRVMSAIIKGVEPVSADLAPGSKFLNELREKTGAAIDGGLLPSTHLVFGMSDRVIEVGASLDEQIYPGDTYEVVQGANHVSVCKFHRLRHGDSTAMFNWLAPNGAFAMQLQMTEGH